MNPSLWQVLIWKEVRQIRAIWLAFVIFGGLYIALLRANYSPGNSDADALMLNAVFLLIPMFTIAAGAALFTGEAEAETDRWLVGRGLSTGSYLATKLIVVLVAIFILSTILVALIFIWRGPPTKYFSATPPLSLLLCPPLLGLCAIAHSIFWSMYLRQTLPAAAVALLSFLIVVPTLDAVIYSRLEEAAIDWYASDVHRYAIITLTHWVFIVLLYSGRRGRGEEWIGISEKPSKDTTFGPLASEAPPSSSWRALAWKEWHRLKYLAGGCLIIVLFLLLDHRLNLSQDDLPLTLRLLSTTSRLFGINESSADVDRSFVVPLLMLLSVIPLVAGIFTFMDERTARGFRFLHHRGISPAKLWLTKIVLWAIFPIISIVMAGLVVWLPYLGNRHLIRTSVAWFSLIGSRGEFIFLLFAITNSLGLYAIGIRCSQLFHAPILSLAVAFLTGIVSFFATMIVVDLGPGPALILNVGIVMLLFASLLRTKDWLADRTGWRPSLWATTSILVPFLVVYVGISIYRMTEPGPAIPAAARPALPSLTAKQEHTTDEFRAILTAIDQPWDDRSDLPEHEGQYEAMRLARVDFAKRNRPHLDRLLAAIQLEPSEFPHRIQETTFDNYSLLRRDFHNTFAWLRGEIDIAIEENDTIRARDRLIAWARLIDQIAYRGNADFMSYLSETQEGNFPHAILDWLETTQPTPQVAKELIDLLKKQAGVDVDQLRRWTLVHAERHRQSIIRYSGINAWNDSMTEQILYYAGLWIADSCERERELRIYDHLSLMELDAYSKSTSKSFIEPADPILVRLNETELPLATMSRRLHHTYSQMNHPFDRIDERRLFLLDIARTLWMNEYGDYPKHTGDAAIRYLGGIPVDVMTGQPMAITSPSPAP